MTGKFNNYPPGTPAGTEELINILNDVDGKAARIGDYGQASRAWQAIVELGVMIRQVVLVVRTIQEQAVMASLPETTVGPERRDVDPVDTKTGPTVPPLPTAADAEQRAEQYCRTADGNFLGRKDQLKAAYLAGARSEAERMAAWIAELEDWKAEEQQALAEMGSALFVANYKGDGVVEGLEWVIKDRDRLAAKLRQCRDMLAEWYVVGTDPLLDNLAAALAAAGDGKTSREHQKGK